MFIARRKRLQPNQHFQHLVNSATAMFSLADCQNRNLALTDVHVAIADSQTANGYGIFDLVLSTVHLNANERCLRWLELKMN
jgi:hypothetical protein